MHYPLLDGEQLIEDLAELVQIGSDPNGGLARTAYSAADMAGREWVAARMTALGLAVRTDAAGNTIARYPGQEPLPPIALGSHTDTVPQGGDYDGSLGVLAALAAVRALQAAEMRLRHPVEIINFAAEEATMSGGTTGSLAMAGSLDVAKLDLPAWDGLPVKEHLRNAGLEPTKILDARRRPESLAAYLELHIEQGDRLAKGGIAVGVVEGIVGIRRYDVVFHGYANHAGTTGMERREDALVATAPFITKVHDLAVAHGIVGTIGNLTVHPGAPNVIPGRVDLTVEIRGLDSTILDQVEAMLENWLAKHKAEFVKVANKPPVQSDPRIVEACTTACTTLGLGYQIMPSGAGHDAMNMDDICPQGMLFVPSQGGVSHSPDEYTKPEDCIHGAQVLLAALIELDRRV